MHSVYNHSRGAVDSRYNTSVGLGCFCHQRNNSGDKNNPKRLEISEIPSKDKTKSYYKALKFLKTFTKGSRSVSHTANN